MGFLCSTQLVLPEVEQEHVPPRSSTKPSQSLSVNGTRPSIEHVTGIVTCQLLLVSVPAYLRFPIAVQSPCWTYSNARYQFFTLDFSSCLTVACVTRVILSPRYPKSEPTVTGPSCTSRVLHVSRPSKNSSGV